jgi:hypothetical protein
MLTLGLMEGVLSATLGLLVLMGLMNENAPMHKILGPPVIAMVGFAAYLIHDSGQVGSAGDVAGLAFFAVLAFFVPLGVMRAAWKMTKSLQPVAASPPQKPKMALPEVEAPATPTERRAA